MGCGTATTLSVVVVRQSLKLGNFYLTIFTFLERNLRPFEKEKETEEKREKNPFGRKRLVSGPFECYGLNVVRSLAQFVGRKRIALITGQHKTNSFLFF